MANIFDSFGSTSKSEWIDLIRKELKDASPDTLQKFNRVEEISLPAYFHSEDEAAQFSDPGCEPYTRGTRAGSNDWMIASVFLIGDEAADNRKMLDALMGGASSLTVQATSEKAIDFRRLFENVGLEYIHTAFYPKTEEQALSFLRFMGRNPGRIFFERTQSFISAAAQQSMSIRPFGVNAYSVQQLGATTWQEIAFALAEGHEYLVAQLEAGIKAEEALFNIHFVFGIGSQYYYEIAKLRAFRTAWATIAAEYTGSPSCPAPFISAMTGFVNVSLKDPYTNLLRQTTEAMSAVTGGVDELAIQPYDLFSTAPNKGFSRRMATNISLLLKEESHLHVVIDAAGGSYALDNLTNDIAERAWEEFRRIERGGGPDDPEVRAQFAAEIREKAQQRLQQLAEKRSVLIGINAFPNPQAVANEWKDVPAGWNGIPAFISEEQYAKHGS
jgi:methylmalonyl-CoA mutase